MLKNMSLLVLSFLFLFVLGCAQNGLVSDAQARPQVDSSPLTDDGSEIRQVSAILDMANLPMPVERSVPVSYTLPNGKTHWYEAVHTPEGGINWVQAKKYAESQGGYLATIHSKGENELVFSLVEDIKYWFRFDHGEGLFNLSGPFLGGYQPHDAAEPDGGWRWVTGEPWDFINWQKANLKIGNKMAPDDQPNNNNGNQNVLAFGEVDLQVSYWSDVPHMMSTYGLKVPSCYGFIIEYDAQPGPVTSSGGR